MEPSSSNKIKELDLKLEKELKQDILPYWIYNTPDYENGGFIGRIDSYDVKHPLADKGVILNTRLLWTFSAAYRKYEEGSYLDMADRAYQYISDNFMDPEYGGCYWLLDYRGNPKNERKHLYAQSFLLYALSEYFAAKEDDAVLNKSIKLFELIEGKCYNDRYSGYDEAFDRYWYRETGVVLGDDKEASRFTMNSHLHLLEAYTNLYKVWQDATLKEKLTHLLHLHVDKMYDSDIEHFYSFFKENWQPQIPEYSYGHDIEAAWLLYDSALALADDSLKEITSKLIRNVSDALLREGCDHINGGIFNAGEKGNVIDTDKQWWVQAEAIVGLSYAWMLTDNSDYLHAIDHFWDYIHHNFKDHDKGEWYFMLSQNGTPYIEKDKVGPWKAPYHTGRMCMEFNRIAEINRVDEQH